MKTFISLLIIHVFLIHNNNFMPVTLAAPGDLIDKTCQQTPSYNLCSSTLRSDPTSAAADVLGFAGIIVKTDLAKSTETLNQIDNLLKQNPEPEMKTALPLEYCFEAQYYPIVKYDFPAVIEDLKNKDKFIFAIQGLLEAGNSADYCEKKFSSGSMKSPISDMNQLVHDLSAIAVSILKTL